MDISLNGKWKIGIEKDYTQEIDVPSLPLNPCEVKDGNLYSIRRDPVAQQMLLNMASVLV